MRARVALVLLSCLLLTGCWDQLIIDDLALVFGMAIDVAPNQEGFYLGVSTPAFSEGAKGKTAKNIVYTRSISQGLMNMQLQRERNLMLGKASVIIFSTEAAKSEILLNVIRQLDQQRDTNPNAWLVISTGMDAREALYLEPPEEQRVAIYTEDMLNVGYNTGQIPQLTISHFWARYHTWGICPVIPTIKKTENDSLMLTGLALVNGQGKMVGELSDGETVMYMLITGDMTRGRMFTEVDYVEQKNRWISIFIKGNNRKVTTKVENNRVTIDLNLRLAVDVINLDMSFEDTLDENIFAGLQTALSKDVQRNIEKVIKIAQSHKTDPFGLGQNVRAQNLQWSRNRDWCEEFSKSQVNVHVEVEIRRIGTLINPKY